MKILSRYLLKEHVGPFVFAASALTSLMLLQYIARRFGDLVGKGLGWQVIAEFFVLSLPFTVAMTLPMAVLVSVLYAFSRLASENEITALKAGGVSMRRLLVPVLWASLGLAAFMLFFNDQVLPRSNHRLQALQSDIIRTKPTFALRPQILNTVKEGQIYLRASRVEQGSGRLQDVVIFDLSDPTRRRSIYADSGYLSFAPNQRDLQLRLFSGFMQLVPTDKTGEITRIFYRQNLMTMQNVASGEFVKSEADSEVKGDREMSVCEMQQQFTRYDAMLARAEYELADAKWALETGARSEAGRPQPRMPHVSRGVGGAYCTVLAKLFSVPEAVAAVEAANRVRPRRSGVAARAPGRDTVSPNDSAGVTLGGDSAAAASDSVAPIVDRLPPSAGRLPAAAALPRIAPSTGVNEDNDPRMREAQAQVDEAKRQRNRYAVEIEKKFSLAATCIIFVLVGAPIALRFPRGGVGLVLGVSFFIFALYYVGLIGGESLADRGYLSPFWAMWGANVIFLVVGLWMFARMGTEATTSRGGDLREMMLALRAWFARQGRKVGLPLERRRV